MLENKNSIEMMYSGKPSYIFGFHGCRKEVYELVLNNQEMLQMSSNTYDWLGNGIYFWENNYQRAVEWAKNRYGEDGTVIGAFINLGYCLDATDYKNVSVFKMGYDLLLAKVNSTEGVMPKNKGCKGKDILVRDLDCAVIEEIHDHCRKNGMRMYDSVRGTFEEGEEMYPGAAFKEKTHTQVCILNPNCIKGYFSPRELREDFPIL